jgi:hypothetical protein
MKISSWPWIIHSSIQCSWETGAKLCAIVSGLLLDREGVHQAHGT